MINWLLKWVNASINPAALLLCVSLSPPVFTQHQERNSSVKYSEHFQTRQQMVKSFKFDSDDCWMGRSSLRQEEKKTPALRSYRVFISATAWALCRLETSPRCTLHSPRFPPPPRKHSRGSPKTSDGDKKPQTHAQKLKHTSLTFPPNPDLCSL